MEHGMVVRFKQWNWEFDFGEGEIPVEAGPPERYAEAHFDGWGRLVRVDCREPGVAWHIEYFCDQEGRVIEKRSYDEFGQLAVLVRIVYDPEAGVAVEEAWAPDKEGVATARVPLSHYPSPQVRRRM